MWLSGKEVQLSHSVVSDSLWPHGLQHTRPPCPPPTPRAYSDSCPSSQWCHPTISSSVVPFSSHLQSFPASGSFPMSQLFTSGGQSIGVSEVTPVVKNPAANTGDTEDLGSIPGWGRSPGEGNSKPLQYSCLENPRERGAWWTAILGVTQSRTLSCNSACKLNK